MALCNMSNAKYSLQYCTFNHLIDWFYWKTISESLIIEHSKSAESAGDLIEIGANFFVFYFTCAIVLQF